MKDKRSSELITDIWERGVGALSVQVLAEFYSTATGKLKMTAEGAEEPSDPSASGRFTGPATPTC